MNENREERRFPGAATVAVVLLALLVLYPLSYGPALWLFVNVNTPQPVSESLRVIYTPLWWVLLRSEVAKDWYFAYLEFWVDLPPSTPTAKNAVSRGPRIAQTST